MSRKLIAIVLGGLVALATLVFLYPLFWMILGSFKSNAEIFNTRIFWPKEWSGQYYRTLFSNDYFPFLRTLANSVFVSLSQGAGATLLAAMAGFVIGTNRFRARNGFLVLGILVVLIPAQMVALPLFMWVNSLGLFDSLLGVALPGMVSGLGLIFFARVYRQVPGDLLDVARMEGASEFRVFLLTLSLVRPFLLAFGFAHFVLSWHAHIIPMLILNSEETRTLPISLAALYGSSLNSPQAVLMAGSSLGMLPLVAVFAFAYPQLKSAVQEFVAQ
jgi:multiple sugar transport system permease protein